MKHTEIYVAHIGTSIMFTGTKEECEAHRASLSYNTYSWEINTLEDYGDECYSVGYDCGYDAGSGGDE